MSATSALECHEDLENVTFVRMEDVQPDRNSEVYILSTPSHQNTVLDHDYSCVFDDEDSNIGSMVSIHSEDVEELIDKNSKRKTPEFSSSNPDSWPTLEILPGGVIKHSEKYVTSLHQSESNDKGMSYACAKCPLRFKFLYNLVKHVRLHETEKKTAMLNKKKLEKTIQPEGKVKFTKLTMIKKKRKNKKCKLPKISKNK